MKEEMLIFVDSTHNNNKFYHMSLHSNGTIDIVYGRVGTSGQKTQKRGGEREYEKIKRSKLAKGYEVSNISLENSSSTQKINLLDLAMSQIIHSDEKVKSLISRLVEKNIHNITSSTTISFNKDSNLFMTPLGPVTSFGIVKAKGLLEEISKLVVKLKNPTDDKKFISLNEDYFKIVPTKISNLRDKDSYMLISQDRIDRQFSICDTLEQTLQLMVNIEPEKETPKEEVFKVEIKVVEDKKTIKRIQSKFEESKNQSHGRSVNGLTIENIYEIKLGQEEENFRGDIGNVWELWHGTKVVNILSILKSGLLMPKETPGQTTGAMFGYGLYFSDQSTKSLNYCDGMFWNNSAKQDKVYMFLAEVAMGNYMIPKTSTSKKPEKGFHSYFAKANSSGVRNNEMIVFDVNQVKLKYLLELK